MTSLLLKREKQRNAELATMKAKKEAHETQKNRELEGKAVIQKLQVNKGKDAYSDEDAKKLDVKSLKALYLWKYGKIPKVGQNKPQLLAAWNDAKTSEAEGTSEWTVEDQSKFERLNSDIIEIKDTKLGRQTNKVVDYILTVLPKMSNDQLRIMRNAIPDSPNNNDQGRG